MPDITLQEKQDNLSGNNYYGTSSYRTTAKEQTISIAGADFANLTELTVCGYWKLNQPVNTARPRGRALVSKNKPTGNNGDWLFGFDVTNTGFNGKLELLVQGGGGATIQSTTTNWVPGRWYFLACSWKQGGTMYVYVDDVQENSITAGASTIGDNSEPVYVMSNYGDFPARYFTDGSCGLVTIHNTQLSAAQIETIRTFGTIPQAANLKLHLIFNGDFQDQSGSGNHGTTLGGSFSADEPPSRLILSDTFADNQIRDDQWKTIDTGGNITESGGVLNIASGGAYNANGIISFHKNYYEVIRASFDLTIPAITGAVNQSFLIGYIASSTLSTTAATQLQLYIDPTQANNILVMRNGAPVGTSYSVAASTSYSIRIIWRRASEASIQIKGGAFANWTEVYTHNLVAHTDGLYFQAQSDCTSLVYQVDNVVLSDWSYDGIGVGDDIADGTGGAGTTIWTRLDAVSDFDVLKKGNPGDTTEAVNTRILADGIPDNGERVYIVAGTQDYVSAEPAYVTEAEALAALEAIRKKVDGQVWPRTLVIGEIPPVTTQGVIASGLTKEQQQEQTKLRNAAYRKFCVDNNIQLCPSYQELCHATEGSTDDDIAAAYDSDGVNFTAAGHNRIGDMYAVCGIPAKKYRWGNTAFPAVDDESWDWWILGGTAAITGDADTGTLELEDNDTASSPVKCLESGSKSVTVTPSVSAGTVVIQFRTSENSFNRDDTSLAWITTGGSFQTSNQFVQIRLVGDDGSTTTVTETQITWTVGTLPATINIAALLRSDPEYFRSNMAWNVSGETLRWKHNNLVDAAGAIRYILRDNVFILQA